MVKIGAKGKHFFWFITDHDAIIKIGRLRIMAWWH